MAIRTITLGSLVALLSSILGIVYVYFYYQLFDFSDYLPLWKVPAIFTFISFVVVGFSLVMTKLFKNKGNIIISTTLTLVTFSSILLPTFYPPRFPNEVEVPEMFPAFVLPLHFFVTLFWLLLSPYYLMKS